ncbi:MAG: hypothetical protein JSU73_12135 [candidate division WOR-3 bacterium]|nr:MAG: hypothetical protein JSU73_12135 [candidate division WOR-3 bacterium]
MTGAAARRQSGIKPEPGRKAPPIPWYFTVAICAAALLVFLGFLWAELRHNTRPGFPLDDSWIHLTFARNLSQGWGFAFNQGEPVAGSTAPLWTLVLAFFHLFTRNPWAMVILAKVAGALLVGTAALFACRITALLTGSRWAGLAAGLGVATLSHFGWAMMSGMEVGLSAALTLAGLYCYLSAGRGWKALLGWGLLGLAAYARPESLMLPGLLVLDVLVRRLVRKERPMLFRGLAVWLAAVVPFFILNFALSGSPFPQTFIAKAGYHNLFAALSSADFSDFGNRLFRTPVFYFWDLVLHLWRANPLLAWLLPVGIVLLVVRWLRRNEASLIIPLLLLCYVPLMGLVVPLYGPAVQGGRYIGNMTALAVVASVSGTALLLSRLRSRPSRLGLLALLAALAAWNAGATGIATARNSGLEVSSINRMQVNLAQSAAENTPPDAVVACGDIGAIGYFSGRRVIDVVGLVTPEMVGYLRSQKVWGQGLLEFLAERRPDFAIIFPDLCPQLGDAPFALPVAYAKVDDNYASKFFFTPRAQVLAGLIVTDVSVEPVPSVMVVFRFDWTQYPGPAPAQGLSPSGR